MNSARSIRTACFRAVACLLVVLGVAGCTYAETDNPIVRKFSWFSYLNGDDVRAACRVGGPEHWRFAYNGIYIEQVRTYDLAEQADGTFRLRVNVTGKPNLSELKVTKPADLLAPWRGVIETVRLGRDQRDLLARAADADGVFAAVSEGLELHSNDFYWTGVVCRNGEVSFTARRWPSTAFEALTFPSLLLAWDPTGIALNPPRTTSNKELYGEENPDGAVRFNLKVGANGLAGVKPLF